MTDDELNRIEEGASQVGQDLAFTLTSFSAGITFLIALATGTFDAETELWFKAAVGVFTISALYTGYKWKRNRKGAPDVISNIRSRRVDPEA